MDNILELDLYSSRRFWIYIWSSFLSLWNELRLEPVQPGLEKEKPCFPGNQSQICGAEWALQREQFHLQSWNWLFFSFVLGLEENSNSLGSWVWPWTPSLASLTSQVLGLGEDHHAQFFLLNWIWLCYPDWPSTTALKTSFPFSLPIRWTQTHAKGNQVFISNTEAPYIAQPAVPTKVSVDRRTGNKAYGRFGALSQVTHN